MTPLTDFQRANIEELVERLTPLSENQFEMRMWSSKIYLGPRDVPDMVHFALDPRDRANPGCGTAACMCGWAVTYLTPALRFHIQGFIFPKGWAKANGLGSDVYGEDDMLLGSEWNKDSEEYLRPRPLGRFLLGETLDQYFMLTSSPRWEGKTDKEWILDRLREALDGTLVDANLYLAKFHARFGADLEGR